MSTLSIFHEPEERWLIKSIVCINVLHSHAVSEHAPKTTPERRNLEIALMWTAFRLFSRSFNWLLGFQGIKRQAWRTLHGRERCHCLANQELSSVRVPLRIPVISGASSHVSEGLWGSEKSVNAMLSVQIYLCFVLIRIKVFAILSIDFCQLIINYWWCCLNCHSPDIFIIWQTCLLLSTLPVSHKLHKAWDLP